MLFSYLSSFLYLIISMYDIFFSFLPTGLDSMTKFHLADGFVTAGVWDSPCTSAVTFI